MHRAESPPASLRRGRVILLCSRKGPGPLRGESRARPRPPLLVNITLACAVSFPQARSALSSPGSARTPFLGCRQARGPAAGEQPGSAQRVRTWTACRSPTQGATVGPGGSIRPQFLRRCSAAVTLRVCMKGAQIDTTQLELARYVLCTDACRNSSPRTCGPSRLAPCSIQGPCSIHVALIEHWGGGK